MMDMGLCDAETRAVDLKLPVSEIRERLENDRRFFEEVTEPRCTGISGPETSSQTENT